MAASSPLLASGLLFLSWFLLCLPPSALPQNISRNIINSGSAISTNQGNTSWLSSSREFAFGLYHLPTGDAYLPAVWFDKDPNKTVVWSATGSVPVLKGSSIVLATTGLLVLYDSHGNESWITKNNASAAAMLDTGEFVLVDENGFRIWSTFDQPTDTILPTQKLDENRMLSSRRSQGDYNNGRFQLRIHDDDLSIYTANALSGHLYNETSRTVYNGDTAGSAPIGHGYQLQFDDEGNIFMLQRNGTKSNLASSGQSFPPAEFYHRATIDVDGVFRHYVLRKAKPDSWRVAGEVPSDLCTAIISNYGSGVCGFNSYCVMDKNRRPKCVCPDGFTYSNPNSTIEGCKPNFTAPTCNSSDDEAAINQSQLFEMKETPNTTWVLFDLEEYNPVDELFCRRSCLDDCLCSVVVFDNRTCLKKKFPLSNGRSGPGVFAKTLVKIPIGHKGNNNSKGDTYPGCKQRKYQSRLILAGSSLLGTSAFLNFLFVSALALALHFSYHKRLLVLPEDSSGLLRSNLRSFTFEQLEAATRGFKEQLGRGAFGTVYKGVLPSETPKFIAVKRLDRAVVQENEREFRNEVRVIGQTHHRNLVRLLGYCDEGPNRLLVYEFMSNGSLQSLLFERPRLNWSLRCRIAAEVARGLIYLHEECSTQIVHCDVKPGNILLDGCRTAKISDFGLAKLLKADQTRTSIGIHGTPGYLAPEWFRNLPLTVKVDVYSFGILLLEIICCRSHVEAALRDEEVILKDWAYRCYRGGRLDLLVGEDDEEAMRDGETLERMVMVGLWCVQEDPSLRPSMKRAARMMSGAIQVPIPEDPFPSISIP